MDCPPTTRTPIDRFVAAPGPLDITRGIIPATRAIVVINIGRSRSRLACMIASYRGIPEARSPLVWSICRMAFFFTIPNSNSSPKPGEDIDRLVHDQ
jgi:hypothetical protein